HPVGGRVARSISLAGAGTSLRIPDPQVEQGRPGHDGHHGDPHSEPDPALLQVAHDARCRAQPERAAPGEEDTVHLVHQHPRPKQIRLPGCRRSAADLARTHRPGWAQHDGAAREAAAIGGVTDPDAPNRGDHVVVPGRFRVVRRVRTSRKTWGGWSLPAPGASSIARCPAPSTISKRALGRSLTRIMAAPGGVTRSWSPTATRVGTLTFASASRTSTPMSPASPSVHTCDGALAASPTTWFTTPGEGSGPNCVARAIRAPTSPRPATTYRRRRLTRSAACDKDPRRGRSSPVTEPITPCRRFEAAVPIRATPRTLPPKSSGRFPAAASTPIPPRVCPITTARRLPTVASTTAATSRPIAESDRSPDAAGSERPCDRRSNRTQRNRSDRPVH